MNIPCVCYKFHIFKIISSNPLRHLSVTRTSFKTSEEQESSSFGYFLVAFPIASLCLGTWQVQRRKWKLGLIDELEKKTTEPPVDMPENLSDLNEMEFRQVRLRGRFDHSKEMFIQPRSLIISGGKHEGKGGLLSNGQVGSWVITPFTLTDRDATILVNRGWIPMKKRADKPRTESLVTGEVDIVGIIRSSEKRAPLASKHLTNDNKIWSRRDVELMAEHVQCEPIFVDAITNEIRPGEPIGGQTRVSLRNEHFSYIVTWYSLSAATGYLWYQHIFKRMRFV